MRLHLGGRVLKILHLDVILANSKITHNFAENQLLWHVRDIVPYHLAYVSISKISCEIIVPYYCNCNYLGFWILKSEWHQSTKFSNSFQYWVNLA